MYKQTHIEINLKALEHNVKLIKELSAGKYIQGVVKANAYGHGDYEIAKALENLGINKLGVARVEEGIRLREKSISSEILVLGGSEEGEFEALINNDLKPVIYNRSMAEKLNSYLSFRGLSLPVHVKLDTGMHRLGVPFEERFEFFESLKSYKHLVLEGLMSHMVAAGAKDSDWNKLQAARFKELLGDWEAFFKSKPKYIHLENSAGFFNFNMDFTNLSRLGIAIYGYGHDQLKPVLRLYSEVKDIKTLKAGETVSYGGWYRAKKDSLLALIPVGYGDGFMRDHRKGAVIINGKKRDIVGVICMDYFLVDITEDQNVKIGDRVSIIDEKNDAANWAEVSSTIVYEVLTLLNPRIRRLYSNAED